MMTLKGLKTSIIMILVISMFIGIQNVSAQSVGDIFDEDVVDIPNIGDMGISYIDPYISIAYDAIQFLLEDATEDFIMEMADETEPPTNALRFLRSADILGISSSPGSQITISNWPNSNATNEYEIVTSTQYIENSYTGQIPVEYIGRQPDPYDQDNDRLIIVPSIVTGESDMEGYRPLKALDAARMGIHYAHFFLSQNDKTYITYPVAAEGAGGGPITMASFIETMLTAVQQTFTYTEGETTKEYTYDLIEWDGSPALDEQDVDGDGDLESVQVTDSVRNFPVFMWALGAITYLLTTVTFPEFCFGHDGNYGWETQEERIEDTNYGMWGTYEKWHGDDDTSDSGLGFLYDYYYETAWFGFGPADLYRDWHSAEYIPGEDMDKNSVERIIYYYDIIDYDGKNSLFTICEKSKSLWDYKESGAAFGISDSKNAVDLYMDLSTRASANWLDDFASIWPVEDEYRTVFQIGGVITRLCYMLYWIDDMLVGLGNNNLLPVGNGVNIVMFADCIGIIALVAIIKFKTGSIIEGKVDVDR